MCFFITLGSRAPLEELRRAAGRGLHVQAVEPPHRTECIGKLGLGEYLLTQGMCSCSLYARPGQTPDEAAREKTERLVRKYTGRGWSAAKIERAVQSSLEATSKQAAFTGLRNDVVELVARCARDFGTTALLVRWDGRRPTEDVAPPRRERPVRADELAATARSLQEEELLLIQS